MVVMKMAHMKHIPEYCDDCIYYGCKPHPYKGWTDSCELCMQCLDDDQEKGWIYDGNGRPANCPLMEVLDKIKAEIDRQEMWLMDAGYNAYNVDIAFNSIRSVVKESEE